MKNKYTGVYTIFSLRYLNALDETVLPEECSFIGKKLSTNAIVAKQLNGIIKGSTLSTVHVSEKVYHSKTNKRTRNTFVRTLTY